MATKSGTRSRRSPGEIDAIIEVIITEAAAPIGAYEIMGAANAQKKKMSPTQVYRSLARLIAAGKVEKIASWNTFVSAGSGNRVHLLCCCCQKHYWSIEETIHSNLKKMSEQVGFKPLSEHIELNGLCASCDSGQE